MTTTNIDDTHPGTDGRIATGSEPQNHPHPGRGEGDHYGGVTDMIDGAVRAPNTYGKGEIENILRNRIYLQSDGDDWRVVGYEDAAEQVLQALQLGRE